MENEQTQPTYTFSRRITKIFHPLYSIPLAIFILPIFLVPTFYCRSIMGDDWTLFGLLVIAFFLLLTFSLVYGMLGYTQDVTYTFDETRAVCTATMPRNFGKLNRTLFIMGKLAALFSAKASIASSIRQTDGGALSWNIEWSTVRKIKTRPRYNYIKLKRNPGLLSVQIFCTKENYAEVLSAVSFYCHAPER